MTPEDDKQARFQKVLDAFTEGRSISRKDLHLLQDIAYRLTETDDVRRFRLKLMFIKDIVVWISLLIVIIYLLQLMFGFFHIIRFGNNF